MDHGAAGHLYPRRVSAFQTDAVDPPDTTHERHPSGQTTESDKEAEARTDVGAENQIDRAHERNGSENDGEYTAKFGLPVDGK